MKKTFKSLLLITSLIVVGTITNSCNNGEDSIENIKLPIPFDFPLSIENTLSYNQTNDTDEVTYPDITIDIDLNTLIKNKYPSLSIDNIKTAKLVTFSLDSVTDSELALDVIKDAKVYLKTSQQKDSLIAIATSNNSNSNINFTPEKNAELMNYLKSDQISFILKIKASKASTGSLKIKFNSNFKTELQQ